MKTTQPLLLGLCSAMCAGDAHLAAQSAPSTPPTVPNFVIFFIDDMGYGDPGSYGGDLVPTPAMDRLAAEGIRATAGYVTSPNCAPSRHSLLTGAYQQRFGIETNADSFENMPGIRVPHTHTAMPLFFKEHGYKTAHVGVWNLTTDARIWFDEVYSRITFGADYFPDETGNYPGVERRSRWDRGARDWGFGPVRPDDEYLTDRLGRQAVDFIEANADQPFFLYFASNAVHSPFHAKEEHRAAVAHIESEPLQIYAAMLLSLDENIGRILDALDRTGVADNTVVFLASDNGPSGPLAEGWPEHWEEDIILGSTGPFSGLKGRFEEGGIRIPYLLRWPGVFPAGVTIDEPVTTLDIFPTFAAAAELPLPENTAIDGLNLLPFLTGEVTQLPERKLFWLGQGRGRGAVRMGDWKLLVSAANLPPRLHNLIEDPAEAVDLTNQFPTLWGELYGAWVNFQNQMPPSFQNRYAAQRLAHEEIIARGPRALHELDPDEEDPDVVPGLATYQALLQNPPDGGPGPLLWFRSARAPNFGSAGDWTINEGVPLTDAREDAFGNPEGAFGSASEAVGGASVGGSEDTVFGASPKGALLLTFRTGPDVLSLASLVARGAFSDENPMELTIFQGFIRMNFRSSPTAKTAQGLVRVVPDTWYTIALSWDMSRSTDRLAWMIGDMDNGWVFSGTSNPHALGTVEQPFRVAGRSPTSAPFRGALQNLAVFDRSLDTRTLQHLFAAIVVEEAPSNKAPLSLQATRDE